MHRRILLTVIIVFVMLGITMCRGGGEDVIDPSIILDLIPTSGPPVVSVDGQPVNVPQVECPEPEMDAAITCPTIPLAPMPTAVPDPGLGVSAVEMKALYESIGFTFQDTISDNVEEFEVYEYGRASDGYDVVEFSGHPDDLTELKVNGTLIEGDDVNNAATALHLLSTFNRLTPTWIDSDDWLAETLWQATLTESDPYVTEKTHGSIHYKVEISESLGSIIIIARRAQ